MANSMPMKPLFCAAIDFGTTYTGLAFAEWGKAKIVTVTWDHDGPRGVELKAPTAVLFDNEQKFLAFGFDAVKKYSRMNDKQKNDCYYFERFKMELHSQERFTERLVLKSTNNPEKHFMKAIKVISFAMKFLKNKLLKIFHDSKVNISNADIRWVITVPAIWRASARQLMRVAAYEAELCDRSDPHNIILSLEPESAALFVHDYLELKEKGITDEKIEERMENLGLYGEQTRVIKYNKYLILDCGGGTIDVCVHQVLNTQDGFTVKECYRATGGAWGGIYVDQKFSELLSKVFSTEFMNKVKRNYLTAWTEIYRDFEFWKRQIQPKLDIESLGNEEEDDDDDNADDDDDTIHIGLPFNFIVECQKHHNDNAIEDIVKCSRQKGIKYQMGKLAIKGKVIRKLLMSQINQITEHIRTLQKTDECYGFKAIFLVGGFSECKVLQSAIKNAFSEVCDVIVPINPSLAIVKGSIKFGYNPTVISQRVSQYTYGLSVVRKFQMDDKIEYKYINSEGNVYCKNVFKVIMRELSPITKDNCLHKSRYTPVDADQKSISISLLKSNSVDVKYTTDQGVEKLGHLHVPLPGTGLNREVNVTVDFSCTEIFASVKNLITGETNFVSVDFLSLEC